MVDRRTMSSTGTPWRDRKLRCATARTFCGDDAMRRPEKVVIDCRTTDLITNTVVTKHGNAPSVKFENEKRQGIERHDRGRRCRTSLGVAQFYVSDQGTGPGHDGGPCQ